MPMWQPIARRRTSLRKEPPLLRCSRYEHRPRLSCWMWRMLSRASTSRRTTISSSSSRACYSRRLKQVVSACSPSPWSSCRRTTLPVSVAAMALGWTLARQPSPRPLLRKLFSWKSANLPRIKIATIKACLQSSRRRRTVIKKVRSKLRLVTIARWNKAVNLWHTQPRTQASAIMQLDSRQQVVATITVKPTWWWIGRNSFTNR